MSLRREHRLIRNAFGALLVVALPVCAAGAIEACGEATHTQIEAKDSAVEVTIPDATLVGADATSDVSAPMSDANSFDSTSSNFCNGTITVYYAEEDGGALTDAPIDGEPDAWASCKYDLPCGPGPLTALSGCQVLIISDPNMPASPTDCWVQEPGCDQDVYVPDGGITIQCADCLAGGGRRTAGIARTSRKQGDFGSRGVGSYLAQLAFEEGVSVFAFERMHAELHAHGAPRSLSRAAERATRDEVRHARVMSRHAARAETSTPDARVRTKRARSLAAMARENAREGCVRETFGALLLAWQAQHAKDPALKSTWNRIAKDEAKHAALSWAVARWAESRLSPRENARVKRERTRALAALELAVKTRANATYDGAIGHPSKEETLALLAGFRRAFHLA